ncbi:LacI family DNA-binding transcriptional regulator [Intestinibacillus massiliensis]|uniref:LacI family DNA-binding transcriptional regulator n=1 Tax=Intestinibacillus massiliensis TaxID=1871029 RepID=UPI0013564C8D|nr:LacI family DNA-binding transcriptional regulator [Intestinibacillus massiliensis]
MAVTLKQIAELAGVSRGTVDRALYDRGRVNPEVAAHIKQIAAELGYQPNRAGRALALAKNPIRIGVIIQSVETPFIQLVLEGVHAAADELGEMGVQVMIRQIQSIDIPAVQRTMDELVEAGCGGIALLPAESSALRIKIRRLHEERQLPIVTFNSDIADTPRLCFVGLNNRLSGQTAAGLMHAIVHRPGPVLAITGHKDKRAMQERANGFNEEIRTAYPSLTALPTEYCYDDAARAYDITRRAASHYSSLAGILICTNGQDGVCRALAERGLTGKIPVIGYDLTPDNCNNLRSGRVDFLLGQDSFSQGYRPIMLLFDYLFTGKAPESEYVYTDIVIKTRYLV